MPTTAEKARAEAEATEAEQQEGEEHDETEAPDETEAEPEAPADPAEGLEEPTELMLTSFVAARDEYLDQARSIMGGFLEGLVLCDHCNGTALAPPTPAQRKLNQKAGTQECPTCGGEGELGLPTRRQGFEAEQCTTCNGKGWVGPGNVPSQAQAAAAVEAYPATPTEPAAPAAPGQAPSTDPRVNELREAGYIVLEKPGG